MKAAEIEDCTLLINSKTLAGLLDGHKCSEKYCTGMNRILSESLKGFGGCGLTNRIFRGSRHGGSSTEFTERAAKRGTPRNAHGTGVLSATRKAEGGRGRPRKAAEGSSK